ncbi:MAG: endonuclease/exonuclease/phosphatase family protein [Planctomycetota bacterium]
MTPHSKIPRNLFMLQRPETETGTLTPRGRLAGTRWFLALAALCLMVAPSAVASTGTFIDRWDEDDLRVFSYNVNWDSIFESSTDRSKFFRLLDATQPDVVALQEIRDYSESQVAGLLDTFAPLGGGQGWNVYRRSTNVIASPYPFLLTTGDGGHANALIDLPDETYSSDFFLLNDHLPCCSNETGRQFEADAIVDWIRDAREQTGNRDTFTLPPETPFALVGDFNIVGSGQPLQTLITGQTVFLGNDSPPDWDGTSLTDARPLHNGGGPEEYTWRNDSSSFDPGVLDYVLYSDSVLETANRFVLNTTTMSSEDRVAAGLEFNDVVLNPVFGTFDHLPLVVDFRLLAEPTPGDFNGDSVVDAADYDLWRDTFGQSGQGLAADGNGDEVVDSADFTIWRDAVAGGSTANAAPEPQTLMLAIAAIAFPWRASRTRHACHRT